MATGSSISPGAALLRGSRMFSLPPKLSTPKSKHLKKSTTQPYPTGQSIATPHSMRLRGDWGLKRPLPRKTTLKAKKNGYVRINQIDTCEGITDFESASDHTVSLFKWHEMGIPLTLPISDAPTSVTNSRTSVFEDKYDFTDIPPPQPGNAGNRESQRWKFTGTVLRNITEGRFKKYLENHVDPKREPFREFVRSEVAAQMTARKRRQAFQEGTFEKGSALIEPVKTSDIPDDVLLAEMRNLREDKRRLFFLVRQFLDLAPIQLTDDGNYMSNFSEDDASVVSKGNPWATYGAPRMHPSAGMMYSRTASYLPNHPLYGPQTNKPPVRSRVLVPSNEARQATVLGVGGWAVEWRGAISSMKTSENAALAMAMAYLNPFSGKSSRIWVNLISAYMDPGGKLHLKVDAALPNSILIERENRGQIKVDDMVRDEKREVTLPPRQSQYQAYPDPGSSRTYGLGDQNNRQNPPLNM
ncbi:37S ribosomal protein mrp51 mitochondrial [Zalerion maritima]|uniref:37S ribosomal protein mrp51 mitochondrial n=1 Tax=Zalerion maritima TaxID=339359 RepID=A0AAD5RRK5_9PEZI|nr:37S ribosomal protein mrp51 mitochondrial [Zalerion maritima]